MIYRSFPELGWLKAQIRNRFQQQRSFTGLPLETAGFPSVVINATVKEVYRPDITGPVSLFMNKKGRSRCKVDGRTTVIPAGYFFLSNRSQDYTLEIEGSEPVETFNVHVGEFLSEQVFSAMLTSADRILENGKVQNIPSINFNNQLYLKTDRVNVLLARLEETMTGEAFNKLLFEETMADLLATLLSEHREVVKKIQALPPMKLSTKIEVYRRLQQCLDYLHTIPSEKVNLEELASIACLSKFHFLRLFRQSYGLSPYQYLQKQRLSKAKYLLKSSALAIGDIADELGFENPNSFSRLFKLRTGYYPSKYRVA